MEIEGLINQLKDESNNKAFEASDTLGKIGSAQVVESMIEILSKPNLESRYLAARTLALIDNNEDALEPLLTTISSSESKHQAGDLLLALEGFDISTKYVDIFKLYLFGSFKVSLVAKDLLDYKEFDITPRVLKKAKKHWSHYLNNVKQDDALALKKIEVEAML